MKEGDLTLKQAAFVREYLIDLNATQAAIRAGYSEKTAGSIGTENLQKPAISRAIEEAYQARARRVELDADYVLSGLVEVAERCKQPKPVMYWDRTERRMVQAEEDGELLWQFDSMGANKALELVGKHLGMFKDKLEHSGSIDGGVLMVPAQETAGWDAVAKRMQGVPPQNGNGNGHRNGHGA